MLQTSSTEQPSINMSHLLPLHCHVPKHNNWIFSSWDELLLQTCIAQSCHFVTVNNTKTKNQHIQPNIWNVAILNTIATPIWCSPSPNLNSWANFYFCLNDESNFSYAISKRILKLNKSMWDLSLWCPTLVTKCAMLKMPKVT